MSARTKHLACDVYRASEALSRLVAAIPSRQALRLLLLLDATVPSVTCARTQCSLVWVRPACSSRRLWGSTVLKQSVHGRRGLKLKLVPKTDITWHWTFCMLQAGLFRKARTTHGTRHVWKTRILAESGPWSKCSQIRANTPMAISTWINESRESLQVL